MINRFENREHAGKILAEKLSKYAELDPVILALPRGGVPVAHEIALKLKAPLDVVIVKKIGAPKNEEFAIGAVAEDEHPILNEKLIVQQRYRRDDVEAIVVDRIAEIRRRAKFYRSKIPKIDLTQRSVIIVDDGLATGATMKAAVDWVKTQGVKKVIVAVPISSQDAATMLAGSCDDFISLITPEDMWAVGMWYKDFQQVSDEEVMMIFQKQIPHSEARDQEIWIEDEMNILPGLLTTAPQSRGLVIFTHGGGSSHKSPRNLFVARALNQVGFSTLLFDLLSFSESLNRKNVFDIELMTKRLLIATDWAKKNCPGLPIGYFGASTGAAAALTAAANRLDIFAVISRGGRPDLAMDSLPSVFAPTLLIVGEKDGPVIGLNQSAKEKLKDAQMVLIPNAGHLFEEPGTLEEVAEYSVNWFQQNCVVHPQKSSLSVKENIVAEIEEHSIAFKNTSELDKWIREIATHKIVMLGESSHGTKEFYQLRREISQKLIEDHGFHFIAVEGDWPDCFHLSEYIFNKNNTKAHEVVKENFHRWPTWMWANNEITPLIHWMKQSGRAGFYGLDVYSLFESLEEIKKPLQSLAPEMSKRIMAGYKCFENYNYNEIDYAKSLLKYPEGCQPEVISNLRELLRLRIEDTQFSKEQLFDIKQNARIIKNAEKYYRTMMGGGAESWNVRDHHMMETLENLLTMHGPSAKAIVWAHNTHIGDYHATDMLESGYINIGGLARERYGMENVYLAGFSTYQGEVTAGDAWGSPVQTMKLPKAKSGSYEDFFHKASLNLGADQLLTNFKKVKSGSTLNRPLGHRAVGVVYDPAHESHGNYVPTQMAKRYDGMIFIDQTSALTPIDTTYSFGEFPETYPSGQ